VFVRDSSGSWSQQAKLTAFDGAAGDNFGESVSVSGDMVVVGASGDDDNGVSSGSAYVFVRDGAGNWLEEAKLIATVSPGTEPRFGNSIALLGDRALIGARSNSDNRARRLSENRLIYCGRA
jgi:FG-GAP repeat